VARILLGVSGGIAAYKALETARLAIKAGHSVRAIMTPTAERFVGAASFAAITGAPVLTGEFDPDPARGAYPGEALPAHSPISHLALAERAEVYLIAPASANTLAGLAHGHADSLLATAALAADCPVIVAPAMNHRMYLHPATQANLRLLADRGVTVLPPGEGSLASHGEHGVGRLPEPAELLAAVESTLVAIAAHRSDLAGARVLISAGGTEEPIDSVRFVGNRSSGRMGYALAERAVARGAAVTVVAANVKLPRPAGVDVVPVGTAAELGDACVRAFPAADVLLMAAAVADFRPVAPADHKLKKTASDAPRTIELEPTEDVLTGLADRRRPGQVLVGFAAEHGDGALEYGRGKLARKRLDAVVVNDISRAEIGFDAVDNEVTIVTRDGREQAVARASKDRIADAILDEVVRLRATATAAKEGDGAGRTPVGAG
jgi:phosphopantothenoylcysteine decarboxylase/phosphopantothenate--cysteine ligase